MWSSISPLKTDKQASSMMDTRVYVYTIYHVTQSTVVSDDDYVPINNQPLTIPSSTSVGEQVCASVIVIGDDIREQNEFFDVVLTETNSNDVVPSVFRITIEDDGDGN